MGSIEPVGVVVVHTNLGGAALLGKHSPSGCGGLASDHHNAKTTLGIHMSTDTLATPEVSAGFDINAQFRSVMNELGLSPDDTGGTITFVGEDPIFPTVHRLGASIGIPIMAAAAGIADIWRQRSGRGQDLSLDLRKAIHGINPM
jgi:hypothetical protein